MAPYVKRFLYASLIYLMIGSTLGALLAIPPVRDLLYQHSTGWITRAHAHVQLVGFVSMMIFGVAYHVLPRFSGQPLWSPRLASWHFVLAQIGLVGMALGFACLWARPALPVFGAILWVSMLFFVVNLWQTIRRAAPERPFAPRGGMPVQSR